jgi:hypothetical protein
MPSNQISKKHGKHFGLTLKIKEMKLICMKLPSILKHSLKQSKIVFGIEHPCFLEKKSLNFMTLMVFIISNILGEELNDNSGLDF